MQGRDFCGSHFSWPFPFNMNRVGLNCGSALIATAILFSASVRCDFEVTDGSSLLYSPPTAINLTVLNSTCWVNDECHVAAVLTRVHINFTFLTVMDCNESTATTSAFSNHERYSNIAQVALNGCSVNREDTLGVEFVPDPSAVRLLSIRMFHVVGEIPEDTFSAYGLLESLELVDNIILGVSNTSLRGLGALKTFVISNCDLQYMDESALQYMQRLRNFTIREPWMELSQLLKMPTDLRRLIIEVRSLDWWSRLPKSLEELSVSRTQINLMSFNMDAISNLSRLHTFNLVYTNITQWPSIQSNYLQLLNLSHNHHRMLSDHDLPMLHTYDVSFNELNEITETTTRSMHKLRFFYAQNNRLEIVAATAFVQNAYLEMVNLAGNKLRTFTPKLPAQQDVRIQVDDNEWDCRWVIDLYLKNRPIFDRLRYAKVHDIYNVHNLRCKFYDQSNTQQDYNGKYPPNLLNIPTAPTMVMRRPKDTAILTLIILVVGVAFLFLLLFLHIKCRRDGLKSFNRFLPTESPHRQRLTDRTDYVRRDLPATEYEAPILCLRNSPPMDDVEKRHTDEGIVYEEIPAHKCRASTLLKDMHIDDCPTMTPKTTRTASKYMQMNTLYDSFHISAPNV